MDTVLGHMHAMFDHDFRMRFLRNKDREAHRDSYPVLYHPEMYLLDGGYKVSFDCDAICVRYV